MTADSWLQQPVLVTGASSGIGFQCALQLAAAGAKELIITGRDGDRLQHAKADIESASSSQVEMLVCDQSQQAEVKGLVTHLNNHQPLGAYIANVGINAVHDYGPTKLHNLTEAQIADAITTNITHLMQILTAVLSGMHQQRSGRILLMGSQGWMHGLAGQSLYNFYKSGLVGLTHSIVSEYRNRDVFCHLLNPGVVLNHRTAKLRGRRKDIDSTMEITESMVAAKAMELLRLSDQTLNGQLVNV